QSDCGRALEDIASLGEQLRDALLSDRRARVEEGISSRRITRGTGVHKSLDHLKRGVSLAPRALVRSDAAEGDEGSARSAGDHRDCCPDEGDDDPEYTAR